MKWTPPSPTTIRAARKAAGLTQVQAAQSIKITPARWQQYEEGWRTGQPSEKYPIPEGRWAFFQLQITKNDQ